MAAFSEAVYSGILNRTVKYERFKTLSERLEQIYRLAAIYQQSEGMMIAGPSGVGKSRIVDRFCEKYPDERCEEYMHRPIIRISLPSQPTPLSLLYELNSAFGSQYATGSKSYELQRRFIDLAKKCRTHLVIIDESQHLVRYNNQKTISLAADTIKITMDQCKVGVLLTGILRTESLLQANRQLASRFTEVHIIDPWQVVSETRGKNGVDIDVDKLQEFISIVDTLAASSGYTGD